MTDNRTRFGILVGVDGSAESDAALRWAAVEAARAFPWSWSDLDDA